LTLRELRKAHIIRKRKIGLAQGERIVALKNNYEIGIKNGEMFYVEKIDGNKIKLVNDNKELIVDIRKYNYFDYAYSITTHKSQGMTVKNVIVADANNNMNFNLFYVALTRGKENLKIYTKDIVNTLYKSQFDTKKHTVINAKEKIKHISTLSRSEITEILIDSWNNKKDIIKEYIKYIDDLQKKHEILKELKDMSDITPLSKPQTPPPAKKQEVKQDQEVKPTAQEKKPAQEPQIPPPAPLKEKVKQDQKVNQKQEVKQDQKVNQKQEVKQEQEEKPITQTQEPAKEQKQEQKTQTEKQDQIPRKPEQKQEQEQKTKELEQEQERLAKEQAEKEKAEREAREKAEQEQKVNQEQETQELEQEQKSEKDDIMATLQEMRELVRERNRLLREQEQLEKEIREKTQDNNDGWNMGL
ncbi:MAG: ATP-binding domain-containing protein, partial [Candidatus Micrarchaeaceae archaeon]